MLEDGRPSYPKSKEVILLYTLTVIFLVKPTRQAFAFLVLDPLSPVFTQHSADLDESDLRIQHLAPRFRTAWPACGANG